MFEALILSLLLGISAHAQQPNLTPFSAGYMGQEVRGKGQCHLQILTQSPLYLEILFTVMSTRGEVIHFEVITLEARPFSSVFNPDFDRRGEAGRTLLMNETVYFYDYAAIKMMPPLGTDYGPVSFVRSQISIRQTKVGEWFETRPIFECPLMKPSASKAPAI
jgi:hypothetical protein